MLQYPGDGEAAETAGRALCKCGPSSLTPAERELIATHVSSLNECKFCTNVHAAVASRLYGPEAPIVDLALGDPKSARISDKLRALLVTARRQGGRRVTDDDVAKARAAGADDKAIHDTVLIAAAFCMFNRYVDGLATWAPDDPAVYELNGIKLATQGYLQSIRKS